MAGSYGSLVHVPTELVRLIRGRPALFPGHASEMYRAGQKRLPVTMTSPTQFNFLVADIPSVDADVQILAAVSFLHAAEISVLQEPWQTWRILFKRDRISLSLSP